MDYVWYERLVVTTDVATNELYCVIQLIPETAKRMKMNSQIVHQKIIVWNIFNIYSYKLYDNMYIKLTLQGNLITSGIWNVGQRESRKRKYTLGGIIRASGWIGFECGERQIKFVVCLKKLWFDYLLFKNLCEKTKKKNTKLWWWMANFL